MERYDLILVGTGFASSFFLYKYLQKFPKNKVAVLERGNMLPHAWRLQNRNLDDYSGVVADIYYKNLYENTNPEKPWVFTPAFGGSSNCWWACTPRLLPNDFKIKTLYGVGKDWPISYEALESYYCEAEEIMAIAGDSEDTPFPRSRPYPQPPHKFTSADLVLKKAFPKQFFHMPTARPTLPTANRPKCCANGVCNLCPIDSKFTVLNELSHLYRDERVSLLTGAQVISVETEGGIAKGVVYRKDEQEARVQGELIGLGANPIFNSHILLNSKIANPLIGKGIIEQVGIGCHVDLNGLNALDGGTSLTGHGYMIYDGPHRAKHAACLVESFNLANFRLERGRYRQLVEFKFVFDDLAEAVNSVSITADERTPKVQFTKHTDYVDKAIAAAKQNFEKTFSALPIERYRFSEVAPTEGHILGTAIMGTSADDSVVDKFQRCHGLQNLYVLGGSSFPAISPANPTLTISALSLFSADNI